MPFQKQKPTSKFAGGVIKQAKQLVDGVGADQDFISDLLGYAKLCEADGHTVKVGTMSGVAMAEVHLGCIPGIYLACP